MKVFFAIVFFFSIPNSGFSDWCDNRVAVTACHNQYAGEINWLRDQHLPFLQNRKSALPALITAKGNEYSRAAAAAADYSHRATSVSSELVRIGENIRAFESILQSYRLVARDIANLNQKTKERLPRLLQNLRSFLLNREMLLAQRIQEINDQLIATTDVQLLEALFFEKQRYVELTLFAQAFPTVEQAVDAINNAFESSDFSLFQNLSLQTQALLREARLATTDYLTQAEAVDRIEVQINEIFLTLQKSIATNHAEKKNLEAGLSVLVKAKNDSIALANAASAELGQLSAENQGIDGQIAHASMRFRHADIYFNCCDKLPHCKKWGTIHFEGSIDPHHAENCFRNGDNSPPPPPRERIPRGRDF